MKVGHCVDSEGKHLGWMIFCPACGNGHLFDGRWTFNGDRDHPTFRDSMLIHHMDGGMAEDGTQYKSTLRCHSMVTDGRIEFLNDCEHELRGQTVDLPEF